MLTRHAAPLTVGETRRPPMELMLRSLPAQHQEILVATYFRGRTTNEAARVLGLAPAAAKARLYQAMLELARMIATCRREHGGLHSSCSAESHRTATSPPAVAPARPATGPKHRCLVVAAHSRRGRSG